MGKKTKEENLNLVKILKDCPEDTKLYSPAYGEVELVKVHEGWDYPIEVKLSNNTIDNFTEDGRIFIEHDGECMLFPSKNQRDWSKFKVKQPERKEYSDSQEITKWAYISDLLPKQSIG